MDYTPFIRNYLFVSLSILTCLFWEIVWGGVDTKLCLLIITPLAQVFEAQYILSVSNEILEELKIEMFVTKQSVARRPADYKPFKNCLTFLMGKLTTRSSSTPQVRENHQIFDNIKQNEN